MVSPGGILVPSRPVQKDSQVKHQFDRNDRRDLKGSRPKTAKQTGQLIMSKLSSIRNKQEDDDDDESGGDCVPNPFGAAAAILSQCCDLQFPRDVDVPTLFAWGAVPRRLRLSSGLRWSLSPTRSRSLIRRQVERVESGVGAALALGPLFELIEVIFCLSRNNLSQAAK